MMATPTPDDKKIVFSGTYYEAWRAHIISGIRAQENIYETIADDMTPIEAELLEIPPEEHQARHRRFLRKQEAAKSFVFNRLTLPLINNVRRCVTVRQVLQKLDAEYRTQSNAAEASARRAFYGLRFEDGGDMKKYLNKFQGAADRLLDSGYFISETEKINQLISSVTKDYDVAITNYQLYRRDFGQSFETLRRLLIDRHERNFDEKQLESRYSPHRKPDNENPRRGDPENDCPYQNRRFSGPRPPRYPYCSTTSDTDNDRPRNRYDFQQPITCHQCGGAGHKQPDCPSKLKIKDEPASSDEKPTTSSYEERKSKAHAMMISSAKSFPSKTPLKPEPNDHVFLLDTGAFKHMSSKLKLLNKVHKLPTPQRLNCASRNAPLEATHVGEMLLEVRNRFGELTTIFLEEVLYVPLLDVDLLSENKITESGKFEIRITQNFADIVEMKTGEITFSATREGDAKYVYFRPILDESSCTIPIVAPVAAPEIMAQPEIQKNDQREEDKWKWHRRLGHISEIAKSA